MSQKNGTQKNRTQSMSSRNKRFWLVRAAASVGVIAVVLAVSAFAMQRAASQDSGASGFCADMPDAVGLYPGNPVTQMGVELGTVDEIENHGSSVRVNFTLATDRPIPQEVRAVTRSSSLLADRSLELVGNYETGDRLIPGECISVERSFTPQTISEITASASDFIEALSPPGTANVEGSINNLEVALQGSGEGIRATLEQAASALRSPDRLVADLSASIQNMAPLTQASLEDWTAIRRILHNMPMVLQEGIDLWPGVIDVCEGVGWLVAVLYDIQTNYGEEISVLLDGPVTQAIRLGAARAPDLQSLAGSLPAVADSLKQVSGTRGFALRYEAPTVRLPAAVGAGVCSGLGGEVSCPRNGDRISVPVTAILALAMKGTE